MNWQQKKALEHIDEKIARAKKEYDLPRVIKLTKERNEILELQKTEIRMSLKDALSNRTPEERRQATIEIIYCVATADLLYGATMDVESKLKKLFGLSGVPILNELREIVKKLASIVKTIDDVGKIDFSLSYADIVEKIEEKYEPTLRNYIHNEILKSSKI